MAVWYQVEKTEEGLQQFLKSNCEFHDYRIERVDYHAAEDYTDVYLAYDTGTEGVLIRFLGMIRLTIPLGRLYAGAWLSGTTVFLSLRTISATSPAKKVTFLMPFISAFSSAFLTALSTISMP